MHDRICAYCGASFVALKGTAKYCTPLCKSRANERRRPQRQGPSRGRRVVKPCDWCGASYTSMVSSRPRFCSRRCAGLNRLSDCSTPIPWAPCSWCDHLFIKRANRTTCSDRCMRMLCPTTRRESPICYGRCVECGALFIRREGKLGGYCTVSCRRTAQKRTRRHKLRSSTGRDAITLHQLAERDRWRCHICGKRVSKTVKVPHPRAPTMDHLVPVAHHGEHVGANLALAHFLCNIRKGDRALPNGEQLRLIS